jgi:hypothetical protein
MIRFIDPSEKWIVETSYEKVHTLENVCARGRKNKLCGFSNANGEEVIANQYQDVKDFSNDYAAVLQGTKRRLMTLLGSW